MSTAYLNAFDNVDLDGNYRPAAQCFDGYCSQPRVDATLTPSFPAAASPQMTVGDKTRYVVVVLSQAGMVYAGPPTNDAGITSLAQALPAGWWPMAVQPGHVVYARDI